MSDAECEACAAGETWDDKAGAASLEEHHSLIARFRTENADLRFEGKILTEAAVNAILALRGGTRAQAMKYLRDSASPLADHPNGGVK